MIDPDTPSSETIHRIPRQHRHCHLYNFDWDRTSIGPKGEGAIEAFLSDWEEGDDPHLILSGKTGTGKTHLAVGIYRYGVFKSDLVESVYVHVPSFSDLVKKSFSDDSFDPMEYVQKAGLLVLDDIFGRKLGKWESEQLIPRLLSLAYNNAAALVITTNYGKKKIASRLDPHETSRLFSNSRMLEFTGEDKRLT